MIQVLHLAIYGNTIFHGQHCRDCSVMEVGLDLFTILCLGHHIAVPFDGIAEDLSTSIDIFLMGKYRMMMVFIGSVRDDEDGKELSHGACLCKTFCIDAEFGAVIDISVSSVFKERMHQGVAVHINRMEHMLQPPHSYCVPL